MGGWTFIRRRRLGTAPRAAIDVASVPEPLLHVRDLTVQYWSQPAPALKRIGFDIACGESVGLLGESGAGKTTLARSLIRLLPAGCRVLSGSIRFRETDMLQSSEAVLTPLRGKQISWISQEPELALSPVMTVGKQVGEVLRAHTRWSRGRRQQEVLSMLAEVGLHDARIYKAYPHELSGGERQRVVIAQSLILKPSLLIADEPTSSLDTATQAGVIDLLVELQKRLGLSLIFITHNPALLLRVAHRIMVMHTGDIVEEGNCARVYEAPEHPYTRSLMNAVPPSPPRFDPQAPAKALEVPKPGLSARAREMQSPEWNVLEASRITKIYRCRDRRFSRSQITAINDVSIALQPASTLALVGKSGSGKSTLARCLAGFEKPDSGEIRLDGRNILTLRRKELRSVRRGVQLIFQHSATALNPGVTAIEIIAEPLLIAGMAKNDRRERAMAMMKKLRIPQDWANRYPPALSGGQRQRLALARALIVNPRALILDEALAGLDLPAQMQIAGLLTELQNEFSVAYLFISHDLPTAALLAANMAVMDRGRIVETGAIEEICSDPQCAATRELIAAIPAFIPRPILSAVRSNV